LAPGEPLALVQELPFFDDSIKMDPLLLSALDLCVPDILAYFLLNFWPIEMFMQHFHYLFDAKVSTSRSHLMESKDGPDDTTVCPDDGN
jgi:hypothetical protein